MVHSFFSEYGDNFHKGTVSSIETFKGMCMYPTSGPTLSQRLYGTNLHSKIPVGEVSKGG